MKTNTNRNFNQTVQMNKPFINSNMCEQLLTIENLSKVFREKLEEISENIFSCFYKCYYEKWVKRALIMYNGYPEDFIRDIADISFTDGILTLKEFVMKKRLYKKGAGIDKIFYSFFWNQLRKNFQKERREKDNRLNFPKKAPGKIEMVTDNLLEIEEANIVCLKQCLALMNEEDKQILMWRHVEEIGNKEIATRLGIKIPSATNKIYRCMEQLKSLMKECKQKYL